MTVAITSSQQGKSPWYENLPKEEVLEYLNSKEDAPGKFSWRKAEGWGASLNSLRDAVNIAFVGYITITSLSIIFQFEDTHWPLTLMLAIFFSPVMLGIFLTSLDAVRVVKDFLKYKKASPIFSGRLKSRSICDTMEERNTRSETDKGGGDGFIIV